MSWTIAIVIVAALLLFGVFVLCLTRVVLAQQIIELEKIRPRRGLFGEIERQPEEGRPDAH